MRNIIPLISVFIIFIGLQNASAESQGVSLENGLVATTTGWTNQDGSVAHFQVAGSTSQPHTYSVKGTYINNASGYGCQGTPYPLTGTYYFNPSVAGGIELLTFSVAWSNASADCMSETSWTGFLTQNGSTWEIVTQWHLAFQSPAGYQIKSGSDTFKQTTTTTSSSLIRE